MDVKVLGPGCRNCITLEERTRAALAELGVDADIEKVTDPVRIVGLGVLSTPGLVVDGAVVSTGRVPTVRELLRVLGGG
ncbi:MAG TPA: thioredoxin family protein [Egicoccus sp.]|nr:thioredoxin family protein [Egicoccus sp.]HSK23375.1 thioredoxin family protein [Egicoccus sp.]